MRANNNHMILTIEQRAAELISVSHDFCDTHVIGAGICIDEHKVFSIIAPVLL